MTGEPSMLDRTVQETNVWLREMEDELGPDRQRAYHALRATLHTLRDRLAVDEAAHLGAQLPTLIRGIYYESWRPSQTPRKERSADEFLGHIAERLGGIGPMNPEAAARATFHRLSAHVSPGEIDDVKSALPEPIRRFWGDGAAA